MAQTLGVAPTFPRAPTSRLQAAQWLVTLLKLPPANIQNPFTDLPDALAPSILSAVQAGIVQGTSATTFDPLGEVTRAEFAAMLFSAQLASPDSGAVVADGATCFSHDGLTLVRQDADDWALLAGGSGLRSIAGVLRQVRVQASGSSITVTEAEAGTSSTFTVTANGGMLEDAAGASVPLPQGVPAAAGVFLLPLP